MGIATLTRRRQRNRERLPYGYTWGRKRERKRERSGRGRSKAGREIATVGNFDLENSLSAFVLLLCSCDTVFFAARTTPSQPANFFVTHESRPSHDAFQLYRSVVLISNKLIPQLLGNDQFVREGDVKKQRRGRGRVVNYCLLSLSPRRSCPFHREKKSVAMLMPPGDFSLLPSSPPPLPPPSN